MTAKLIEKNLKDAANFLNVSLQKIIESDIKEQIIEAIEKDDFLKLHNLGYVIK